MPSAAAQPAPPPRNTGVPLTEAVVGVDYLTVTQPDFSPSFAKHILAIAVGEYGGWAERPGLEFFRRAEVGPFGAIIAWEPLGEVPTFQNGGMVRLPGQWWKAAGERAPWAIRSLAEAGFRCSRIDVQATLAEGASPRPEEVHAMRLEGVLVSPARRGRLIDGRTAAGVEGEGVTVEVGGRKSERFLRIYDKTAESRGEVEGIRWEVEFKGETAAEVFRVLAAAAPSSWGSLYAAELGSFVDFRDPESDSNITRRRRLQWWADMLTGAAGARVAAARRAPALARTREFVNRLGPTLAVLAQIEGGDVGWLVELVEAGSRALKGRHYAMLAEAGALA